MKKTLIADIFDDAKLNITETLEVLDIPTYSISSINVDNTLKYRSSRRVVNQY